MSISYYWIYRDILGEFRLYLDFLVLDQLDWCSLTRLDSCYLEVSFLMDQVIVSRLDELMVSQRMI
jgi:hypothetical protein